MTYIVCTGSTAVRPYAVKDTGIGLYSLDELCYYIYHNIYDLDEEFVSDDLIGFLLNELELSVLANRLKDMKREGKKDFELLTAIVSYGDYLSAQEFLGFKTSITRLAGCRPLQRYKLKADSLFKKGMTDRAIKSYQRLIGNTEFINENDLFKSYVYYNLAVAYAHIFHYKEAFSNFYSAYRYRKDDRNAFGCLMSMYLGMENRNEFMKKAVEYGFSISRVAHTEEIMKDSFRNSERVQGKSIPEIVESARIAMR